MIFQQLFDFVNLVTCYLLMFHFTEQKNSMVLFYCKRFVQNVVKKLRKLADSFEDFKNCITNVIC